MASLRRLMAEYYGELTRPDGSAPVAWCTSVGPVELLRALGFRVYFPENHGALLGATRSASDLIPAATAAGYSPEVCSYLTSDIGSTLRGESPLRRAYGLEGPPAPQVLVYNTNQCREVQDWFAFYQRRWGVPLLGIVSPRSVGQLRTVHLEGLTGQYRELAQELCRIFGCTLDEARLCEVVSSSHRCSRLWGSVLRSAAHRPSPLTFFDTVIHMGPAVVLRGDPRAEVYYRELLGELAQRTGEGVAAVEGERHRLYWEGMPIWGRLRQLAELFDSHRACVVGSTYGSSWVFDALGADDPWEAMARAYLELFIVRDESRKEEALASTIGVLSVDAIVFHEAKTCPHNSNTRFGLPGRLGARLGLPSIVLHGDLCDLRLYSDEQARTQIEALLEQLEAQRRRP